MAPLAALIERAQSIRQGTQLVRSETVRLSHESAEAARQLAARRRTVNDALMRTQEMRRSLPTWPASAPPDTEKLKLTLVPLE